MTNPVIKKCISNYCEDACNLITNIFCIILTTGLSIGLIALILFIPYVLGSNVNCEGTLSQCFHHKNYNPIDYAYGLGLAIIYILILIISIFSLLFIDDEYLKLVNNKFTIPEYTLNESIFVIVDTIVANILIFIPGTYLGLYFAKISPDSRRYLYGNPRYGTHYVNT